jgi:hypothetical protein
MKKGKFQNLKNKYMINLSKMYYQIKIIFAFPINYFNYFIVNKFNNEAK